MSVIAPSIVPERAVTKTPGAAPRQTIDLRIGGMTCPHCPPAIEKVLRTTDGVASAHVNLVNQVARVEYDPSRTKVADILGAIRSLGYTVGTAIVRIPIANMHCSSCITQLELALQMTPGVVSALSLIHI